MSALDIVDEIRWMVAIWRDGSPPRVELRPFTATDLVLAAQHARDAGATWTNTFLLSVLAGPTPVGHRAIEQLAEGTVPWPIDARALEVELRREICELQLELREARQEIATLRAISRPVPAFAQLEATIGRMFEPPPKDPEALELHGDLGPARSTLVRFGCSMKLGRHISRAAARDWAAASTAARADLQLVAPDRVPDARQSEAIIEAVLRDSAELGLRIRVTLTDGWSHEGVALWEKFDRTGQAGQIRVGLDGSDGPCWYAGRLPTGHLHVATVEVLGDKDAPSP